MKQLETTRLILKDWRTSYAPQLFDYAKNPNVGPHAGWKPHESVKESKMIIKKVFLPNMVWAIEHKETQCIIGSIGLEPDKYRPDIKSKELGYSLNEEFWGKGLMTEAAKAVIQYSFVTLGLEMLTICTGSENFRSQSIIKKCGFTYEGTLRKAYRIFDGSLRDVLCYSIMKEEYFNEN
ncbi:MAG: GNAT family protein [Anaerovoracaceae bacterium]